MSKQTWALRSAMLMLEPDYEGLRPHWQVDLDDRDSVWDCLLGAIVFRGNPVLIKERAEMWGCTEADAIRFADRQRIVLRRDGNAWMAAERKFRNIQESFCGFGPTPLDAMATLYVQLLDAANWGDLTFGAVPSFTEIINEH